MRSATRVRSSAGVGPEGFETLDHGQGLRGGGVDPGPGGGTGEFADSLADLELRHVRLWPFGAGSFGHPAAGGDEVGIAQQFDDLHPGCDLLRGRVLGQLGCAHGQLVGDIAGVVAEDSVEVVVDDPPTLFGRQVGQVGHTLELLGVGGSDEGAQYRALQSQHANLGVEGAYVLGGHLIQRRFGAEHPLDVVQADAELAQGADEPRPGHGVGPEQPVSRRRASLLGQHSGVGVEP